MLLLLHHPLLGGMGQILLRYRWCRLRRWDCWWRCTLGWNLYLRGSRDGAWNQLRMRLGYKALWSLVLRELRLEAVLLMWLKLSGERLLVLGGHVSMRVHLLGLKRRMRARDRPWSWLVPLRERLPDGLRELLQILRSRRLGRALNRNPWVGHHVRVRTHLR